LAKPKRKTSTAAAGPAPKKNAAAGAPDPKLIEDLVAANRILYHQGVVDGFGHVSARHDKNPQAFLLSRSMAPALVTAADIMQFDLDGNALDARGRTPYLERFIHAAIYRARPDVNSVIHSHSPCIIPFGVTGTNLRPIYHMSGFLGGSTPIYDIRAKAGMTDMLIRDMTLGLALAESLGDKPVALMRGHGSVAVGASIRQAVFRAVYTEVNARLQIEALKLGTITFLDPEEAKRAAATNDAVIDRGWDLWKREIGRIE
jgi:ribulose-5-phosphate 4-epimerase/fuculose-1-phosphate aldolase